MGTSIDRFLARTHGASETDAPSSSPPLALAIQHAPDPDRAARVLKAQAQTGLPSDLVSRQLDAIEQQTKKPPIDADAYERAAPKVAGWLAEDPHHAAIAADDYDGLSYLERQIMTVANQFTQGKSTVELQGIGEAAMLGTVTPEQRKRQAALEQELGGQRDYGIGKQGGLRGFLENVPGYVANQIPIMASTFKSGALGAAVGGGVGALAGAATGPGALASGGAGAAFGWRTGSVIQAGRMEGALAYLEFEKIRDEQGNPLDRRTMVAAASLVGAVNGFLEGAFGIEEGHAIPGLRALGREEVARALQKQTTRQAIVRFATEVAKTAGEEGVTEFAQDYVKNWSGALATMAQDGSLQKLSVGGILDRLADPAFLAEAKADALAGAGGGGGMAMAGAGMSLVGDVQRARRAGQAQQFFTALGEGAKSSKLLERMPEKMQEVVSRLTKDGPLEHVYVPAEFFQSHFDQAAPAVAEELGISDAYEEAMRTGQDIAIPTAKYAVSIAPTEHHAAFVPELRFSPAEMNGREAAEFTKAMDAADREQTKAAEPTVQAADQVQSAVAEQLNAAGFDATTAAAYAALYGSTFRTLGERTGQDPLALFNKYGLSIQRPEVQTPAVDVAALAKRHADAVATKLAAQGKVQEDGMTRYEGSRTPSGGRRDVAKVSTDGLLHELLDLEAKRADAEARGVYEVRQDESFATSGIPQIVSTKDKNGGPSMQAKAGRNLADYARITDEVHAELQKRGLSPDEIVNRVEDARAALDQREGQNDNFDIVKALNDVLRDESGRELFQPSQAGAVALADHASFMMPIAGVDGLTPLHKLTIATPQGNVIVDLTERDGGKALDVAFIHLEGESPANRLGLGLIRQVGGVIKSEFPQAQEIRGERVTGASAAAGVRGRIAEFHQVSNQGPRGRIRIGEQSINIDLFETADLSTFLHETGHFYLEVLRDMGEDPKAVASIREDYDAVRRWLGLAEGAPLTRDAHEQFARGFEAYLMDGKAPTSELRRAFAKFRAWLVGVYRSLSGLNVQLTPEVTGVFDRLLATDDEIQAAEQEQHMVPLFPDPAAVGMTEAQATKYRAAIADAHRAAEETLSAKLMTEWRREEKQWWKDERAKFREGVVREVDAEPATIARAVLQKGTMPDGSELPPGMTAVKLSRAAITEQYGPDVLKSLPRPYVYAKTGGITPNEAAALFGFRDGAALLQALATSEPRHKMVDRITDERMKQEYGDILTDGRLPVAAMAAVHTEQRAELLRTELQHLATSNLPTLKGIVRKVTRRVPPIDAVRAQAERTIAAKKVRDINPLLYQRAEAKAARLAVEHVLKGDFEAAFEEKQRELQAHELYRAATQARGTVDGIVTYMRTFDAPSTRARIGKAGGEYLAQIDAIRERYSFSQIPLRAVDKTKGLSAWIREQEAQGITVDVPQGLIDQAQRQHFKDATVEELTGVRDAVKQIAHLAKTKNRLLASARARDMEEARTEIRSAIGTHYSMTTEPIDITKPLADRLKHGALRGLAEHTRMEFLFEHLDGHVKHGPVWQYFFKPFADAEDAENTMRRADAEALSAIFNAYTKDERAAWFTTQVTIPGTATDRIASTFTKANILAVALNWGNEYNRSALMEGYGWSEGQVEKILAKLDDRDWRTVQAVWDHIDTYWPAAEALEREVTGLAPEKVERAPFTTPSGLEMSGGYYPVAFDREQSSKQAALDEAATVSDLFGGLAAKAMTRHGHLKERTNTGGKPLKLELGVLSDHLSSVVHDLAFRRAVIDVSRLTRDDTIRETIEAAAGREMYQQLGPWLKGIAGDRSREPITVVEKLLSKARMGATVVALGLKVTSSLVQTLGYTLTVKEIGPKYATAGMREMFGHGTVNPFRLVKPGGFIAERSPMMRDRIGGFDRDIRDATRRPDGLIPGIDPSAWFAFVGYMDLGTSIPTWLGAYRRAMDGAHATIEAGDERSAVEYADSVVRTTQAAGAAKDLAAVQRGSEAMRLYTTFYSSMSILFNQFQQVQQEFALTKDVPKLIAGLALVWFLPAVLEDTIRGRAPSGDDADEKLLPWLLRKEVLYPFSTVVLVRDIANAIDRGLETGQVDASNAFLDVIESIAKMGVSLGGELQGKASTRADYKNAANVAGYLTHLPSRQLWTTGSYLYDWMTGITQPTGPFNFLWHAAATGTPREDLRSRP